jgi:glucose/arabinose dehydrogenase
VWKFGGDDASIGRSIKEGSLSAAACRRWQCAVGAGNSRDGHLHSRGSRQGRREQSTFARPGARTVVKSELHAFKLETVVIGLEVAWGLDFSPRRSYARDRKAGRLRIVDNGALVPTPVAGVPAVWARGARWAARRGRPPRLTRPTAGSTCPTATRDPTGRR